MLVLWLEFSFFVRAHNSLGNDFICGDVHRRSEGDERCRSYSHVRGQLLQLELKDLQESSVCLAGAQ